MTTRTVKCDVMLGDSTTKQIETFDIKNVETFFQVLNQNIIIGIHKEYHLF